MPLRKSPTGTPSLLAANRANARKSTGPRTSEGKGRVALNALRHGLYPPNFLPALNKWSRAFEEFSGLYRALYAALLPDRKGMALLRRTAVHVWATKRQVMRHPLLGYCSLQEVPEGVAPGVVVKTKPESTRKQKGNRNVIPIKDLDHFSPERRSGAADQRRFPPLRSGQPSAAPRPALRDQNHISR